MLRLQSGIPEEQGRRLQYLSILAPVIDPVPARQPSVLMEVIVLVVVGVVVVVGAFVMGLMIMVMDGGEAVMLVLEGMGVTMMVVVGVAMLLVAVFVGVFVLMMVVVAMTMLMRVFAVAHCCLSSRMDGKIPMMVGTDRSLGKVQISAATRRVAR